MFTFKVIPDDGEPYEVSAKSRDVVQWEKRFRRSIKAVQESMSMTALTELAYVASSRRSEGAAWGVDYSTFEASVDIELVAGEDDDADPTRPDR